MSKLKGKSEYLPSHDMRYGIKVSARDSETSQVLSVTCRLCDAFGREQGGIVRTSSDVKYFSSLRTDLYLQHHKRCHPERWEQYKKLRTDDEKEAFLDAVPFANTIRAHMESSQRHQLLIKGEIVNTVIGELLFRPDDMDGRTRERAMKMFHKVKEDEDGDEGQDSYEILVSNLRRFEICVDYLKLGGSFRMIAATMDVTREHTGISLYGGCDENEVAKNARIVCAHSLQILSEIIGQVWCFSLAIDGATHQGMSYLDVRVRFHWKGEMLNYHLIALPLFARHTGENMFSVLEKFLNAVLSGGWLQQCICVSSDGARNMTGETRDLVSRISRACPPGMYRVWCGLHKLDLVMQQVYESALDKTFMGPLYGLIGYLRRQQNLIGEMNSSRPKVAATRWVSMHSCTSWLVKHRIRIMAYLEEEKATESPDAKWWIFLHGLEAFAYEAHVVFKSLQGRTTLLCEQQRKLRNLIDTFSRMTGMEGPFSPEQIQDLRDQELFENTGQYILTKVAVTFAQ